MWDRPIGEYKLETPQGWGGRERDCTVDDFIALVGAVDGLLVGQAAADADYFLSVVGEFDAHHKARLRRAFIKAYRYQYILSGGDRNELVVAPGWFGLSVSTTASE